MSRWVVVDDTDQGITYTGPWFADNGAILDNVGNFGAPYLGTSHGTNGTASLSYTFTGSKVLITGSNQFFNPTGIVWQCIVDGMPVSSVAYSVPVNNLLLCERDGLDDTRTHVITVNATVSNQQTFWFDYVKYLPPATLPLDNAAVSIDSTDSDLDFGVGWTPFSPGLETTRPGASLKFNFTGVSLLYYGFYDPSLPFDINTGTGRYSIDGQTPVSFDTVLGVTSTTTKFTGVRYNQLLFTASNLSAGQHTLDVSYQGAAQGSPLTFEFLVVQNGTAATVASPGSASGPSSTILSPSAATATIPGPAGVTSTGLVSTGVTLLSTSMSLTTDVVPTATTTTSGAFASYSTSNTSMLGFVMLAITLLCRRSTRS